MARGRRWREMRDYLVVECRAQGIRLDTYDPDFIVATIQTWLGANDSALTSTAVRPFRNPQQPPGRFPSRAPAKPAPAKSSQRKGAAVPNPDDPDLTGVFHHGAGGVRPIEDIVADARKVAGERLAKQARDFPGWGGLVNIEVTSGTAEGVGDKGERPFLTVEARAESGRVLTGQLTPAELRGMAMQFLEVAEAAEQDAMIFRVMTSVLGSPVSAVAQFVATMRKERATVTIEDSSRYVPMTLTEASREIGSRVTFHYLHGEEVTGIITSTNAKNVFVRFKHFPGAGSEACDPERLELTPVDEWFWLSFVDPSLPDTGEGTQFVGGCLVPALTIGEALTVSHVLGINPGDEVQGLGPINGEGLREDGWPTDGFRRLLSRAEIREAVTWDEGMPRVDP